MARSVPGLQRLIVVTALAGFWLGVALVVAVLAAWPTVVVTTLGAAVAVALASTLGFIRQVRKRTRPGSPTRKAAAAPEGATPPSPVGYGARRALYNGGAGR